MEVCSMMINCCRTGQVEDVKHILTHFSLSLYPKWSEGYLLLCEALKNNEIEIAKLLLQSGAKVNIDRNGISKSDTPLHYAIRIENMEIIEILLNANSDVNATNKNKRTPLHLAIDHRNEEIVKLLLKKGADVKSTDKHGYTLLHLAAQNGDVKIVQHLINHEVDVNSVCKNYTALYFAVKCSNIDIVKLLIQNGAIVNPNYSTFYYLLQLAVYQNNETIVQLLLENSQKVDEKGRKDATVLYKTVEERKTEIGKILLDNDCSVNDAKSEIMPIHSATEGGDGEIVQPLDNKNIEAKDYELVRLNDEPDSKSIDIKSVLAHGVQLNYASFKTDYINEIKGVSTLLHTALTMKRKEIAKILLNHGFDANAKNEFGRTPMYYAYKYNDLEMCTHLLANGACMNSKITENLNLLHMAVENKDEKFVKFLLEEGADINATTNGNCTSLHIACRKGSERIVKLLLKHNIDVHAKGNNGMTSLHEAVKQDNERIVKLLLRNGSVVYDTTDCMSTSLHIAAQCSGESVVQRLLKYGADVNAKDNKYKTALCYAVETSNACATRLLLDKNLDVNDKSNKLALCLAILGNISENSNIVEIFLFRGFTINSEDFNEFPIPEPLYSRYINDYNKEIYVTVFRGLLKRNPSINTFFEYQVLRSSIEKGFVKIIKSLLRHDANINILLEESCTLLHIAVKNGQIWIAEELLKRGANVNALDIRGRTPLHVSVLNNFTDVITFLLKYKVDVEARDEDGKTALHLASDGKDYITKLLLDAGANVNSVSNNQSTPLHIAAESGHEKVVKLLLDYDAEIDVKNRSNETPLDLAIYWQRMKVASVLIEYGAMYNISSISSHNREIYEIMMMHSTKLQAVKKGNAETQFDQQYDDFWLKCNKEVEKMVHHHIGTKVSLYDILIKEDCIVEMYMRNQSIFHFLDDGHFEELYPIYANMLEVRANKAKKRNLLVVLAGKSLESMLEIKIPYLVFQKLFSFVNNLDLRNLIHATPTD